MSITYDQVERTPRIPLWPLHLYRGTVTLLAGPRGMGKGLVGIHAAGCTVRGAAFPGFTQERAPASVIGVWPEDDANEDIAGRLDGCLDGDGLTLSEKRRVIDMTEYEPGKPFSLQSEPALLALRAEIARLEDTPYPCRLAIVDPLNAVTERITTNGAARAALAGIVKLAKNTGVAVLILHHTTKDGKTIAGSSAITEVPRLVFRVEEDLPANPGVIFMVKEKANNFGDIPKLAYGVAGTQDEPWLLWAGHNAGAANPGLPARGVVPAWMRKAS